MTTNSTMKEKQVNDYALTAEQQLRMCAVNAAIGWHIAVLSHTGGGTVDDLMAAVGKLDEYLRTGNS